MFEVANNKYRQIIKFSKAIIMDLGTESTKSEGPKSVQEALNLYKN